MNSNKLFLQSVIYYISSTILYLILFVVLVTEKYDKEFHFKSYFYNVALPTGVFSIFYYFAFHYYVNNNIST